MSCARLSRALHAVAGAAARASGHAMCALRDTLPPVLQRWPTAKVERLALAGPTTRKPGQLPPHGPFMDSGQADPRAVDWAASKLQRPPQRANTLPPQATWLLSMAS